MSLNFSLDGLVKLQWSEIKNHFEGIENIVLNKDGSIRIFANQYSEELQQLDNSHIHLGEGVDVSVVWHCVDPNEHKAFANLTMMNVKNKVTTLFNLQALPAYIWDTVINGLAESTILFDPEISAMVVDAGARDTFIISMLPEENTSENLFTHATVLSNIKKTYINNAFALYSRDLHKAEFNGHTRDTVNTAWENIRLPQHNLTLELPVANIGGSRYRVIDGNGDKFSFATINDFMWWLAKNVYNT